MASDFPISDHFNGRQFHNPTPRKQGFSGFLRWMANRRQGPWLRHAHNRPGVKPPTSCEDLRITWIGHSTVLIQMNGLNLLTDPIWSERASPFTFAGPKRWSYPGIRFRDLPPIHVVLLSHDHYDHMDKHTLQRLNRKHQPVFITGLGNSARLRSMHIKHSREFDWWDSVLVRNDFKVTAVPAHHFSGRSLFDHGRTLWCGFVLSGAAGNVYFAGDTAFGTHFEEIATRFHRLRTALLPIGAFRPEWFMGEVHESPLEAFTAHRVLGAKTSMAMHFGTFALGDDGQDEAPEKLRDHLRHTELNGTELWIPNFGDGRDLPA